MTKKEKTQPTYCSIGGQGVIEGVMMRAPKTSALAVRREDGSIAVKSWETKNITNKFLKLPIVRGAVNLVDSLYSGVKVLSDAARLYDEEDIESYEPNKFEKFVAKKTGKDAMGVMMLFAVIIAVVMAVGLFYLIPWAVNAYLLEPFIENVLVRSLLESAVRMIIFIGYMILCTLMKEVKRVFMYHGAEHKTITCYEAGLELNVENVRKQKRLHPRCGTSFLLLVMLISVLVYAVISVFNLGRWASLAIRLLAIPLIAGFSYEVLKICAKYENWFTKAIRWPGMQLQRLTTKEPDDEILEIGILSFEMALGEKNEEELEALKKSFEHIKEEPVSEAQES